MYIINRKILSELAQKCDSSVRDLLLLISSILHKEYSTLFFRKSLELTDGEFAKLNKYMERLKNEEPISKILQKKEFYGIEFKTSKHTLDPRPETELIVDLFRRHFTDPFEELRILDLGSGTGCIGLSLLTLYKKASAEFVDISKRALDVALENAGRLSLSERCRFTESDWFSEVSGEYAAIVSNPPYIANNYPLSRRTLYDPEIALFAGDYGLDCHAKILARGHEFLENGGRLFLEIGFDQTEMVLKIKTKLKCVEVVKDISGVDRVIVFTI
jgi:release factor glutamine methyltransferase